jgi:hypothetical protein|mmetsp:Transcript_33000/g.53958  ORF Transcript_33000/g.53958 Transcript_33000/m.53958 type:complete len:167 (-) Transcript_33000:839-1339(-)|eukprot:CAMPEP_0174300540 /NCGR_PEP_ID=MMETSP0809-20121228/58514_1 /TAXON_ID=73025 ORGANISM="Eutreptiella gymnastica-like, Strain CCMP1594" /NCGR_SAMPLE_ID=MMETSP0809 /ASSEMBLY_ACC=CAM_ASM_000658 /LENGTH=166 /DNA_ID=CAMNT_0015406123 /DNA_START=417 /DNA_END=917 /DNA_ORIENTATION=-
MRNKDRIWAQQAVVGSEMQEENFQAYVQTIGKVQRGQLCGTLHAITLPPPLWVPHRRSVLPEMYYTTISAAFGLVEREIAAGDQFTTSQSTQSSLASTPSSHQNTIQVKISFLVTELPKLTWAPCRFDPGAILMPNLNPKNKGRTASAWVSSATGNGDLRSGAPWL